VRPTIRSLSWSHCHPRDRGRPQMLHQAATTTHSRFRWAEEALRKKRRSNCLSSKSSNRYLSILLTKIMPVLAREAPRHIGSTNSSLWHRLHLFKELTGTQRLLEMGRIINIWAYMLLVTRHIQSQTRHPNNFCYKCINRIKLR
jgi:hypothetical protein